MAEQKKLPSLWEHQKLAIARATSRFALLFDPGCGKSRTAIEMLKQALSPIGPAMHERENLYDSFVPSLHGSFSRKTIIFAPLNVCRNWQNEITEYLGEECRVYLVAGQTKTRKIGIIKRFSEDIHACHKFLICNLESLRSKELLLCLEKTRATAIIADEFHNFKSPNSLQTKGLMELDSILRPKFFYLLTGTPAPQGEIDLWSLFYILGMTKDPFFIWRKKHFQDKNEKRKGTPHYWPDYKIYPKSRELFAEWLKLCSMSARKDEVLDLPELLRTNIYAEMSLEQARHYETMKEFLFAVDKDGNELNAANMLTRTLRLQQILAGFIGDAPIKDNPRLKALDAAIEKTNGEQFIVWTIFASTYKQLGDYLESKGISYGFITGEQSSEERHEIMKTFQAGNCTALIAHPKAGGVGVNLTAASYSIHYTRSFSLTDDLQCEARNYRGGSERHKRITRIDIITPDTIDEDITSALRAKKTVQDFILNLKKADNERRNAD